MNDIVYLLGAGANQLITDWDGLKPPLSCNFFQMALQSEKFSDEYYVDRLTTVYDYISRHWKKSISDLRNTPFNLEDFSLSYSFRYTKPTQQKILCAILSLALLSFYSSRS